MIYPNNPYKGIWDNFITFILILTCTITPYRIAFVEEDDLTWELINGLVDLFFLFDLILCFLTAYYTDEFELVEDRSRIAMDYITSWFIIDLFAIFPF